MASLPPPPSSMQCIDLLAEKFACEAKKLTPEDSTYPLPGAITVQILDALASICVAKSGQTFAVSVDVLGDNIVLRIAGNGTVAVAVEEHFEAYGRLYKNLIVMWQSASRTRPPHFRTATINVKTNYLLRFIGSL